MDKQLPILAHGEEYIESVQKKPRGGEKSYPYTYDTAKFRLLSDLDVMMNEFRTNEEMFMPEKVLCIRMEPKFEAKSYIPSPLVDVAEESAKLIGGRKYSPNGSDGVDGKAKLYYVRSTNEGIHRIFDVLSSGERDGQERWRHSVQSIHTIDIMPAHEKVLGFPEEWEEGPVEFVLHPMGISAVDATVKRFLEISGLKKDSVSIKSYEDGLTFIGGRVSRQNIEAVSSFNPLRSVHPVREYDESVLRSMPMDGPEPPEDRKSPEIKVGVFDSGLDTDNPYFTAFADNTDLVENSTRNYCHGNSVVGALLYGNVKERKGEKLSSPPVYVKMFRVFPEDEKKYAADPYGKLGLYETIDHIEETVPKYPDIRLYNLSLGPHMAILDDELNRFTYALDRLTYQSVENGEDILFAVACGNDGQELVNRIQPPSDMVNGLGVGAYTRNALGDVCRAAYSCVGPGREGAKIKPDILEFGGSMEHPFISMEAVRGKIGQFAGTSYATPLVMHKIGEMLSVSGDISPHMARTLLIHNASLLSENKRLFTQEEGFGYVAPDFNRMLHCTDNQVTILYEGELSPAMTAKLPVFAPGIDGINGMVKITWTITTIVNPNIYDVDAYTGCGIEDSFYPHSQKYTFRRGTSVKHLNLLEDGAMEEMKRLVDHGYQQAGMPDTKSPNPYRGEDELRNKDLKWDTVVKKSVSMRSSSLYSPYIAIHAMSRNGEMDERIKYFMAVTIEAPHYRGSLYDRILSTYPRLTQIKARTWNRVRV